MSEASEFWNEIGAPKKEKLIGFCKNHVKDIQKNVERIKACPDISGAAVGKSIVIEAKLNELDQLLDELMRI